jgi:hypothetical protein
MGNLNGTVIICLNQLCILGQNAYISNEQKNPKLGFKKTTYNQLLAQNVRYKDKLLKLQEEIDLLRKSFLPKRVIIKTGFTESLKM